MPCEIRAANVNDAAQASGLIWLSAESALSTLFAAGQQKILNYLQFAFAQGGGLFGCDNHWVATHQGQVIAIACGWHNALPQDFDRQSVLSLHQFWGVASSLEIITRNQLMAKAFSVPGKDEVCLGHFAVAPQYRGQGFGRTLITHFVSLAKAMGKKRLVLDVETDNTGAIGFYRACGFTPLASSSGTGNRYLSMAKDLDIPLG